MSARIMQGSGLTAILLGALLGGVVTAVQPLGFPGSPIQSSLEVEPVVRNIVGSTPGAGLEISESCPVGARWEVISVSTRLAADGSGVARHASLEFVSGVNTLGHYSSGAALAPGATADWVWAQNLLIGTGVSPTTNYMSFPQRQFLRAGDLFRTSTGGEGAGDQYTAPVYQVLERLEVA